MNKIIISITILCSLAGVSAPIYLNALEEGRRESAIADCNYRSNMLKALPIETQGNLRIELLNSLKSCDTSNIIEVEK